MKRWLVGFGVAGCWLGAMAAPGGGNGEKTWGEWTVNGSGCRSHTVETLQNGDALSVIFSEFGLHMPAGEEGDGLEAKRDCHFKIRVKAPKGMELAGASQVYSGGMIKSAKSNARLGIRYHVGEVQGKESPLVWRRGVAIPPEDPGSLFTYATETPIDPVGCARPAMFHVRLILAGARATVAEHLLGGVDTFDAEFRHRVKVKVRWKPCRPGADRP